MKKCPVCHKYEATIDPTLGVLPCFNCQEKRRGQRLKASIEFTSDSIKEDRKKYAKDILQPFRDGELSKEYIEAYGSKGIEVNNDEIKHAVNTTDSYYV